MNQDPRVHSPFSLLAAWVYTLLVVVITLLASAATLFYSFVLRKRKTPQYDELVYFWAHGLAWAADLDVEVQGSEYLDDERSFVVMQNHTSFLDIPAVFVALGEHWRSMRMLTKRELFRIPLWGPAMRHAGFIPIDRSDRQSAQHALDEAREALAEGTSIWIAPEGRRSPDGSLQKFKKGGFHLALATQTPILPVVGVGLTHSWPKGSWTLIPSCKVQIRFGPPIETAGLSVDDRDYLLNRVRAWMQAELETAEQEALELAPAVVSLNQA